VKTTNLTRKEKLEIGLTEMRLWAGFLRANIGLFWRSTEPPVSTGAENFLTSWALSASEWLPVHSSSGCGFSHTRFLPLPCLNSNSLQWTGKPIPYPPHPLPL
jgi:hypothetical protein